MLLIIGAVFASVTKAATPASCSINTYPVNDPNTRFHTVLTWSNAYGNQWFLFHWGDEAQTGKDPVGFIGQSGRAEWEHEYNPGTWEQWANVSGPGGWSGCKVTVTAKPIQDSASCSIETSADSGNPFLYHTKFSWSNMYDGEWSLFHWGDEEFTQADPPGFRGPYGTVAWDHVYHPGTWEQWANVSGPGGNRGCKVTVSVKPAQAPASCSITTNPVNVEKTRFHTTLTWNNTYPEQWFLFHWGDEEFTQANPVGFIGQSGSTEWEHEYNPGTWEQWANVNGSGGAGGCKVVITAAP